MAGFRILHAAGVRLDEIYDYSRDVWGEPQAQRYVRKLFACFGDIVARRLPWRAIPSDFGIDGYYARCERHYVYWRVLSDGEIGIVTILHERMQQMDRFRQDLPT